MGFPEQWWRNASLANAICSGRLCQEKTEGGDGGSACRSGGDQSLIRLLLPANSARFARESRLQSWKRGESTRSCPAIPGPFQGSMGCLAKLLLVVEIELRSQFSRQEWLTCWHWTCHRKKKPFDVIVKRLNLDKSRGDRIRTYDLLTPSQTR